MSGIVESAHEGVRAEIVTIGDEILDGRVLDTNAQRLGRFLSDRGIVVWRRRSVADRDDEIVAALADAAARSRLVLTTGGLGPTEADRTRIAVARLLGVELELSDGVLARIAERFRARGMEAPASNRQQALFPAGARVLTNPVGTAPGFAVELAGARILSLPGVPAEVEAMLDLSVSEYLVGERLVGTPPTIERFRVFGLAESALQDLVAAGSSARPESAFARFRVDRGEIDFDLVLPSGRERESERFRSMVRWMEEQLGPVVVSRDGTSLAERVARRLIEQKLTVATAESCTGGLVAHLLTQIPGISAAFLEGIVAYSNEAKVRRLGVDRETLAMHGAVSEAVVGAMATGAIHSSGAHYAVATSGILGPTGGTPEKPAGLVWFALAKRDAAGEPLLVRSLHRNLPGDREFRKWLAAKAALDLLRRELDVDLDPHAEGVRRR